MRLLSSRLSLCALAGLAAAAGMADPLSRKTEIDFFRDVPSRDLHGLATRSDGRLVAGPQFTDLTGPAPADILWCVAAAGPQSWYVGTGPNGEIEEVTPDLAKKSFTAKLFAKLEEAQIFALAKVRDGALLAGSSPRAGLSLVDHGKVVARVGLPADSIFDIVVVDGQTALVGTGNPGTVYTVDLKAFAKAGVSPDKVSDKAILAQKGITVFGEIRDRNVRRMVRLADGSLLVGSAPKGNLYRFGPKGGAPAVLQENRDAEVTDLLAGAGGFYAAIVYSGGLGETRLIVPPKDPKTTTDSPAPTEHFAGRGAVVWFPDGGFPETISARAGVAFYRLARQGNDLIVAGGEQGDVTGVELDSRKTLTFPGSVSAQINGLVAIPGADGKFLALRNNAPGLGVLDFGAASGRSALTRRIDLGTPGRIGALRFQRLRDVAAAGISLQLATSNTSDDTEGWSEWQDLVEKDGGWTAALPLGRYIRLKLALRDGAKPSTELDKADLYYLPQDHRPVLQDFHELSVNFALIPSAEPAAQSSTTISQILQGADRDAERRHAAFLSSQIVPSPGTQVVFWTVNDVDGDALAYTYSIHREGDPKWTDLAVQTHESYAQFDTSHLAEGTYFTRLTAEEVAPRAKPERLSVEFDTDDLVIDHTPPAIVEATARREGDLLVITVHGKDALSLLDSLEVTLNNGVHEETEQPVDGIRDSREETFRIELPLTKAAGATSAEVILYDAADNSVSQRISW